MSKIVTASESRHMSMVARLACLICKRLPGIATGMTVEVHHVASGSDVRSGFATAPLCAEHHRGKSGLHGMGVKAFCALYRPPFENEFGLLVWTNEDLERMQLRRAA